MGEDLFGQKFSTMTGVHDHFAEQGVEPVMGNCDGCKERRPTYPYPLPGFGTRCAMCIVMGTTGGEVQRRPA